MSAGAIDFEALIRARLTNPALPTKARVLDAVMVLESEGVEPTRLAVAEAVGLSPRTVEDHLYSLRNAGMLTCETLVYRLVVHTDDSPKTGERSGKTGERSGKTGEIPPRKPGSAPGKPGSAPRFSGSGVENRPNETTYILPLTGEIDARDARVREEDLADPAAGRASGFPSFSDLGAGLSGCTPAVARAWEMIPRSLDAAGHPATFWITQLSSSDALTLGRYVEQHGEATVLRAIDMLVAGGPGRRPAHQLRMPPRPDYLERRIDQIRRDGELVADSGRGIEGLPHWIGADMLEVFAGNLWRAAAYVGSEIIDARHRPEKPEVLAWLIANVERRPIAQTICDSSWHFAPDVVARAEAVVASP